MKSFFGLLMIFVVIALTGCRKDVSDTSSNSFSADNNVLATDTVKIPLTEMGTGTYLGYKGGLYPNGVNQPPGQYATDLQIFASSVAALDTSGKPSATGSIGFISIGGSTGSIMMAHLVRLTRGNTLVNPQIKMVNCCDTGTSINEIDDTISNDYWTKVAGKLKKNNLNSKQVEIIYLETDDTAQNFSFPSRPANARIKYENALRIFKIKFKNIKLVYLTGRTTTFPPKSKIPVIGEPTPYYNGWACKWAIQDQINGVAKVNYKGANAVAALATWGWYEWSVGYKRRSDGFIWTKEDTSDGLHATDSGGTKLATYFQNFLLSDPYAKIWYARH